MNNGRPTTLTPEVQAGFLAALRRCWYVETACHITGIPRSTVYGWLKRGRREQGGPYADFLGAIKKALAEKEADCLSMIEAHGKRHWQALAWLLERRFPDRWGNVRAELRRLERTIKEQSVQLEALRRG